MSNVIDLNGIWEIRPDPDDRGVRERWFERPPADGWLESPVPSAWQHTLGTDYHGVAWYHRRVRVPAGFLREDPRLWLRFESVATDCRVWVNGREVGRHVGDYLPFQFEITGAMPESAASTPNLSIEVVARVDELRATRPRAGATTENGHITKGFHDVLSLQHGGIWGQVLLKRTGPIAIAANGIRVTTDLRCGEARFDVEFEPRMPAIDPVMRVETQHWWLPCDELDLARVFPEFSGERPGAETSAAEPHRASAAIRFASIIPWSPRWPALAFVRLTIGWYRGGRWQNSDLEDLHIAFRTVTTGGPGNRNILLNGEPVQIRGVLHWGHEPRHIAPAPTPQQVGAEFDRLRDMGFNCVCLCMWYPPDYYYDLADAHGMLIWQEHPVWKSRMERELMPEYQRLFEGFLRRDRRHPSVVIVSGSCEHERIHPELAAWWWKRAKEELPDRLVQVQTAFTSWVNPEQTDLHDEHVYESSGRWVKFLEDMQGALGELPPKAFVMGETIIGTAWAESDSGQWTVDSGRPVEPTETEAETEEKVQSSKFKVQSGGADAADSSLIVRRSSLPWWAPKGLKECRAFERSVVERYGVETLERFKGHAARNNLLHRKFQSEVFRSYPNHAGWVMNQIRDVPAARLGFMDELDRWRFSPDQTRPWLCDCPILFKTPDWRAGFLGGRTIECSLGVANFGPGPFEGDIEIRVTGGGHERAVRGTVIRCARGDVAFAPVRIDLPRVEDPTCLNVRAAGRGLVSNVWKLWVFPEPGDVPDGGVRLDGLPFDARDRELDFEERAYSSGWGLKVRTWKPVLPHPETLLFRCPLWRFDAPMAPNTRLVVTHKLTAGLVDWMQSGGRVLWLAAGRTRGSLPTRFVTLWGQCPLVPEEGPLGSGDSEWVVDLLHHDLTRRYTRAIPIEDMPVAIAQSANRKAQTSEGMVAVAHSDRHSGVGIVDQVDPIVRYVFTHDTGAPKLLDGAFMTRVGRGLLVATSLDHTEDAGQYLLRRLVEFGLREAPVCRSEIDTSLLRAFSIGL